MKHRHSGTIWLLSFVHWRAVALSVHARETHLLVIATPVNQAPNNLALRADVTNRCNCPFVWSATPRTRLGNHHR
jgi:hypothetical protein